MEFKHELPKFGVVDRLKFIINECEGKSILHLGAVDYNGNVVCGLHKNIIKVAEDVIGIDIDKEGIKKAKMSGIYNIYYGNVENLENFLPNKKFHIILATEIIEHLDNLGLFLESIKQFFGNETKMIITTPNSFSLHHFAFSFLKNQEYVHPEHTCYYSYNTLKYLLKKYDFKIENVCYYTLGRSFEKMFYKFFPQFSTGLMFIVSLGD